MKRSRSSKTRSFPRCAATAAPSSLGGEAGMGKSRLVHELSQRAVRLGCTVMSGAAARPSFRCPTSPFSRPSATTCRPRTSAPCASASDRQPTSWRSSFRRWGALQPATGDPIQAKLRLFEAILLLLRDAARGPRPAAGPRGPPLGRPRDARAGRLRHAQAALDQRPRARHLPHRRAAPQARAAADDPGLAPLRPGAAHRDRAAASRKRQRRW